MLYINQRILKDESKIFSSDICGDAIIFYFYFFTEKLILSNKGII
ncbi:hypothetical protein AB31_4516 [Escherichia coli 2-222-05_S1_C2]|nr:hypothetical protein AB31_4516 [Escherichia coli 2-222-05_S1_C2]KDX76058.1 hypothetical protein AB63_4517 [Escherichia coli 2-222-05_S1_C3]